jgi:hypothetical protein
VDKRKDVISLSRLLADIGDNVDLFTRENFVGFDGLPYDYEVAKARVQASISGSDKQGYWTPRTGPDAYWVSEAAHREFDRLSGIAPVHRSRTDQISKVYIEGVVKWLDASEAGDVVTWTHKYLAHAADRGSRGLVDLTTIQPTLDKMTGVTRTFVRVSEALHALFLAAHGNAMPTAQFDPFVRLVMDASLDEALRRRWDELTAECDAFPMAS